MLGEAAPVGPPPPETNEGAAVPPPAVPPPAMSPAAAPGQSSEERAARAAAAMNIDMAALMASSTPRKRASSWVLPVVVVVGLIVMLMIGLNMVRKLGGSGQAPPGTIEAAPSPPTEMVGMGEPEDAAPALPGAREIPAVAAATTAAGSGDPVLQERIARAELFRRAGDWTSLASHARVWGDAQPERNEPLLYMAQANEGLGNKAQAEELLRRILARDPANLAAGAQLADMYQPAERFSEAAELYKRMVASNQGDSRLWNNYGAALFGAGQQAQAQAALEMAVRLDPNFKDAWRNLGTLYQSTGDTARASAAFANAR